MNISTPSLELRLQTKSQVLLEYDRMSSEDKEQVAPEWLARVESSQDSDPWVHGFKMVLRSDGTEVGRCGFTGPPDANGVVELAYGVDEKFRNRVSSWISSLQLQRQTPCGRMCSEETTYTCVEKCVFSPKIAGV